MTPEEKAKDLGVEFTKLEPGYLNLCIRSGNLLITSGHTSTATGVLGAGLSVEDGYAAARDCAAKILNSVHNAHGTINGLKVIKLLGCVYSAPDFTDQHLVINGASDLLHEIYGKEGDGYHARSALGFAALPTGAAVEALGGEVAPVAAGEQWGLRELGVFGHFVICGSCEPGDHAPGCICQRPIRRSRYLHINFIIKYIINNTTTCSDKDCTKSYN